MDYLLNLSLTTLLASLGYLITVGIVKPYLNYDKTKSEIGIELNYYSNIITSPGVAKEKIIEEAERVIRRLAMRLEADYLSIQFRSTFVCLQGIPKKQDILSAKRSMVFLSNSLRRGETEKNHIELGNIFVRLRIDEVDLDSGIVESMEIYKKHVSRR